jgi:RHS repeat-associated protein
MEYDSTTGQYYDRARYYDAAIGRFMGEDPLGFVAGDANLYRYVGNSVTDETDPSGLVVLPPGALAYVIWESSSRQVDEAHQAQLMQAQQKGIQAQQQGAKRILLTDSTFWRNLKIEAQRNAEHYNIQMAQLLPKEAKLRDAFIAEMSAVMQLYAKNNQVQIGMEAKFGIDLMKLRDWYMTEYGKDSQKEIKAAGKRGT